MPGELTLSFSALYGFLLVLVRIAGIFVFVPLPGTHSGPSIARIVLALACTMALVSRWPAVEGTVVTSSMFAAWMLGEAAIGMVMGLAVAFLAEALAVAAQLVSLQAGYAYASTIDPATQADSGILLVIAQLTAGLLFFSFGLDRQVLYVVAKSLDSYPPGSFSLTRPMAEEIIKLGASVFSVGLRLALPVLGLLIMVDLALALLGRINSQLQVIMLAFPVKIMLSLLLLIWILALFPAVYESYAAHLFGIAGRLASR